ncbi:MAG TPA: THUMP domain-containing protein [Nitrososphaera sp.]|nr:THUMP domain-containing protein [Nitrososphaera sp.]
MGGFNLVFSTSRFREEEAQDEILDLLDMFGDGDAEAEITEVKGLLLAQTALDPFAVVGKLKELVASEPWKVRYILRVLPIEAVVPTELDAIRQAAKELVSKIGKDSFRITVEKRHSPLESIDVIKAIAGEIESKVDLENPGWIVLVEVVGNQTGVSVIRPDQMFSAVVEKRR